MNKNPSLRRATPHAASTKLLHPRNIHKNGYDFSLLLKSTPALESFLVTKNDGSVTVDFADPDAVITLNRALLRSHYSIEHWTIPNGALCPPIPGRVDYIHHIADLLSPAYAAQQTKALNSASKQKDKAFKLLDIGTGASGIYALLAAQQYGWECAGSDINAASLDNFSTIIQHNPALASLISVRLQPDPGNIFKGIISPNEHFDISVCNPPFHDSPAAARRSAKQKTTQLAQNKSKQLASTQERIHKKENSRELSLNFGGQDAELWCNGGERLFLKRMIRESKHFASQCDWFTSLVSKSENLKPAIKQLNKLGATDVRTINMHQGNKKTRILAWSFVKTTAKEACR